MSTPVMELAPARAKSFRDKLKQFQELFPLEKQDALEEQEARTCIGLCRTGRGLFLVFSKTGDRSFLLHCDKRFRNCLKCREVFRQCVENLPD